MKIKSTVMLMICLIFLLEVMLHFLIIGLENGIQQKVQSQEFQSYILTTEQGCTISRNYIDIRPTNVSFNLQTTRVKQNFPVSTKESQSKSPILPPVSQPQPKPNVAKSVKSHTMPVTRNIVTTAIRSCS